MRLVPFLLSAALAAQVPSIGQGPHTLPWQPGPTPPWQPLETVPASVAPSAPQAGGPVTARLAPDGTLEVWNGAGVRTLRLGLPGRPKRVWRDGGADAGLDAMAFPASDPLSNGLGALPWNAVDFRGSLTGLLWVLEDGERVLTVAHPATAQAVYLPLPRGEDFDLAFEPTRLVVIAKQGLAGHAQAWALPWLALLPQFARLGPPAQAAPKGTALKPYPTSQ